MTKAIVFDLGGTLMECEGMPMNWSEYYYSGFSRVNELFALNISEEKIYESVEILKSYNPRSSGMEYEIAPETMFDDAVKVQGARV